MYQTTGEYLEQETNPIPHQIKRASNSCRMNMRGRNPHPSETFPRIPCHEYYPCYCNNNKGKVCVPNESDKVIVNLGRGGNIEVSHLYDNDKDNELVQKTYPWNKLPTLLQPISNNIPKYIRQNAWAPVPK